MAEKLKIIDLVRAKKNLSADKDWEDRVQKYKPTIQKFIGKLRAKIDMRQMYGDIISEIESTTKNFSGNEKGPQTLHPERSQNGTPKISTKMGPRKFGAGARSYFSPKKHNGIVTATNVWNI